MVVMVVMVRESRKSRPPEACGRGTPEAGRRAHSHRHVRGRASHSRRRSAGAGGAAGHSGWRATHSRRGTPHARGGPTPRGGHHAGRVAARRRASGHVWRWPPRDAWRRTAWGAAGHVRRRAPGCARRWHAGRGTEGGRAPLASGGTKAWGRGGAEARGRSEAGRAWGRPRATFAALLVGGQAAFAGEIAGRRAALPGEIPWGSAGHRGPTPFPRAPPGLIARRSALPAELSGGSAQHRGCTTLPAWLLLWRRSTLPSRPHRG